MQKSFKLLIAVLVVTALSSKAVAQTVTYKEVFLDGKPAKLNVVTGEITLINVNTKNEAKRSVDSIQPKTEIEANLITAKEVKIKENHDRVFSDSMQLNNVAIDTISVKRTTQKAPIDTQKVTTLVYEIPTPKQPETNTSDYHIVKKGETLYALSKRYNTSLGDLKLANNLETTLIKIGQSLRVRNFEAQNSKDVWVVSKGDTLYSIARKTNTTVAALKSLNGLTSNLIKIGQKLLLK